MADPLARSPLDGCIGPMGGPFDAGVVLGEVNMKTMESRIQPGLFFAGEIIDIDGVTGGFNFQAAWTGGYLAGRAMADKLNP